MKRDITHQPVKGHILLLLFFLLSGTSLMAHEDQFSRLNSLTPYQGPDLTSLNIRLSHHPVFPPENLIKEKVDLPNVQAARMLVGPSPQAAILEDDHHQRVMILSAQKDGHVRAQVLIDFDLLPRIPMIATCAENRGCAHDRRPITGGLGCIAICVQQALDPSRIP